MHLVAAAGRVQNGSMGRRLRLLLPILAAAVLGPPLPRPLAAQDAAADLKSPDVKVRLAAVARLEEGSDPAAEDLLVLALDDRDGEVVERACTALARKATEKKALRPLAELAMNGSMRRVRLAAAAALGARLPEEGAKLIQGAVGSKDDFVSSVAAEALAEIRHPSTKEKLRAGLGQKSPWAAREAAQALGSLRDPSVVRDLDALLRAPDIRLRCGAIEGLARTGDLRALPSLLTELQEVKPPPPDIVERRLVSAYRRLLWTKRGTDEAASGYRKAVDSFRNEKNGGAAARLARLLASLARAAPAPAAPAPADGGTGDGTARDAEGVATLPEALQPPAARNAPALLEGEGPLGDPEEAVAALVESGLAHADPLARRASAWALGRIGGANAIEAARKATGTHEKDDLTRFHALRSVRRWRTARDEAAFQTFANVLQYDKAWRVREEAAVALGVRGLEGALDTLVARMTKDDAWQVVVSSAVSLGKTRDPGAVAALTPFLSHRDWRVRGAAAAGIGWTNTKESIPALLPMLSDAEVSVARTAWEFLKRVVDRDLPLKAKEWEAFWAENGKDFQILDREKAIRDAKRFGYALNDKDVYEGLDVCVLESRGDKIEDLLKALDIRHRKTKSASVKKDGVQPLGAFVSNCTGEVQPDDHERIQWFVHAGGALFGSCWAIDKTIGQEFGLTMRRNVAYPGQVVDQVRAEELPTESEYLNGVFPGLVRPIYELYGAYLIEVLDPERLEVLIDSPETAAKFNGAGNLAAWFTAGHGVVMGSSNHFDRQTMSKLQQAWGVTVKTENDRRAFAVNHFGLSWERVRELDARGVFARQAESEREVADLSAFRFLTNFVRRKRIVDL
jgi:HEAT repeat protein